MGGVRSILLLPAWRRMTVAVVIGVLAAFLGTLEGIGEATLIGISTAGVVFVASGWMVLWPMNAKDTKENAQRQDLRHHVVNELVVVVVTLAGLCGIATLLVAGHTRAGTWQPAVAVFGVFMSWAAVHLMYAARYAHLFYDAPVGGIDFHSDGPAFRDFLYFSYTIGMTYQVSDTDVSSPHIRAVLLRHALLAYIFGTAILATTINLVVGALAR